MSYRTNKSLPNGVVQMLPEIAQTVWRKAFNSAYQEHKEKEAPAAKAAWAAVKTAGYRKPRFGVLGRWKKNTE